MDKILILDFGSQTTQLIGRRIRELGVYSEIVPGDADLGPYLAGGEHAVVERAAVGRAAGGSGAETVRGIILSGSPFSVNQAEAPRPDSRVYSGVVPVLGICYGLQRMMRDAGGRVEVRTTREYGSSRLRFRVPHPLFEGVPDGSRSWMSHGDSIEALADGFELVAESEHGLTACAADPSRKLVGIQFHPEVSHCEHGPTILSNFVFGICKASRDWSMEQYVEQAGEEIRALAGKSPVLLLISGGVDSTVVAALLLEVLDPSQVHLLYIDTGLMRKNETGEISANLLRLGARNLNIVDAGPRFLSALAGVSDPEEKRRIIGDLFITVQEEEVARAGIADAFLAQGTLYTDLIESGHGVGKIGAVIKSHHNVRSPLILKKRSEGKVIEPLRHLYKDEVRKLGIVLGVSPEVVGRHPFPGPGLAVRILGEVTREKCDVLREADDLYIRELKRRNLYDRIWQAFAVLLPVQSVGVAGDAREYGYVLALRAVVSADGMTADVFPFPGEDLLEISSLITNRVREVGRVVYDVSSKPPATIEWE